jgi:putative DNA primase/helicase
VSVAAEDVLLFAQWLRDQSVSCVPLATRTKMPDGSVLPNGWKAYQQRLPTDAELLAWFGTPVARGLAIVLGEVSGLVAVETDSTETEQWCLRQLPPSPWMTRSARGIHRYYQRDANLTLPDRLNGAEVKRDGQILVAPYSVHPTGHVYAMVEPWTSPKGDLPILGAGHLSAAAASLSTKQEPAEPLPEFVNEGGRHSTLFREGCRLRRLGFDESEIEAALMAVNKHRCDPPLDRREVASIARSCARYKPAADLFPLTEAGDAEFFAAVYGERVRFDHRRGRWLLFDGNIWAPQTHGELTRLALDAVRGRQRAALRGQQTADADDKARARLRWATQGESRKRIANLLELAKSLPPIADPGDSWDLDPWLLGVPNGIVDLRSAELRRGHPEDRVTRRARVPYDAAAACPLWDQTLAEIFQDDAVLLAYVDRYIGYSLTGDCREESLAICYGAGANGKGTLMNTIGWLLSDYADDLPASTLTQLQHSGIPNDIAKLVGRRFVTASETAEAVRLNEARVKALTGRDPITARFLHQEFFTFQPVAKFWLATNHKPEVRDDSEGFWRRIHLIPFEASFIGREDRTLKDRLRAELPGILARAVRGCLAWQREGLNPPPVVVEATKAYRTDSLPLTRFLDECCLVREGARATFGQLFKAYVRWSSTSNEGRLSRPEFNDALHGRFEVDPHERRAVTFIGVGLLDLSAGDEL